MNLNSPIGKDYKYAYKPFLIISILNNVHEKDLFNKPIKINEVIAKSFYDLNVENEGYFQALIKDGESKKEWEVGFNKKLGLKIISLILRMPASKLVCDMWSVDTKNKTITFNFEPKNKTEFIEYLRKESLNTIKKCIPEYKNITIHDLESTNNFDNYYQKLIENSKFDSETKNRKFQHIFRKKVLDRDKKCQICGLETNYLLEAAHIKPYCFCSDSEFDKYSESNGIALCKNHHKMFDQDDFTIDTEGNVRFSKSINKNDKEILFKNYKKALNVINEYNKKYFVFRFSNIKNKTIA